MKTADEPGERTMSMSRRRRVLADQAGMDSISPPLAII